MRRFGIIALFVVCAGLGHGAARAQAKPEDVAGVGVNAAQGTLAEIKDKRRVLLLVSKSPVLDTRDPAKTILTDALKKRQRFDFVTREAFAAIAKRLNKYLRQQRTLTAVNAIEEADVVLVFNVLRLRIFDGSGYPYGEMFAIIPPADEQQRPRIVWRSKPKLLWAGDAAHDFIEDFKTARGEK